MKTTVEISDVLFARARLAAKQRGTSFRSLIEVGLTSVLNAPKTRTPKPFRDMSFGGHVAFPEEYLPSESGGRVYDAADGELLKREY